MARVYYEIQAPEFFGFSEGDIELILNQEEVLIIEFRFLSELNNRRVLHKALKEEEVSPKAAIGFYIKGEERRYSILFLQDEEKAKNIELFIGEKGWIFEGGLCKSPNKSKLPLSDVLVKVEYAFEVERCFRCGRIEQANNYGLCSSCHEVHGC